MSDENKVRLAHDVLDGLSAGRILSRENEQLLRSFLPERPKQKTLAELTHDVYEAWGCADGNDWSDYVFGELKAWLDELHTQLKGLETSTPALPKGMRLADHETYGRCVVSPGVTGDGFALILALNSTHGSGAMWKYTEPDALTFTEAPAKSTHPDILETKNDYSRAPRHTIVAHQGEDPWVKLDDGMWITTGMDDMDEPVTSVRLGEISRRVLRWGDGK